MSSSEWVTHAGHDWRVLAPDRQDPDHLGLGVALDYGAVDEGPSQIGALALLTAALREDLQQGVGDGRSSGPSVSVDVGPTSTTVTIRGRRPDVLALWDRLGNLFAAPHLAVPVEPVPTPKPSWPQELAVYTGANALTLGDLSIRGTRDLAVANALLAHLAPEAGRVRHVFITDDPRAVGVGWSGRAPYGSAPARPPLHHGRQPALVLCDRDDVIAAVAFPAGPEGRAGANVLGLSIGQALADLGVHEQPRPELISLRNLDVMIFSLADQDLAKAHRRRILDQVLSGRRRPADELVDRAGAMTAPGLTPDARALLDASLRLAGQVPVGQVAAPGGGFVDTPLLTAPVPAAATRRAYEELVSRIHVPLLDDTEDLVSAGFVDVRKPWLPDDADSLLWAGSPSQEDAEPSLRHTVYVGDHFVAEGFYLRDRDADGRMRNQALGRAHIVNLDNLAVIVRRTDAVVDFIDHQLNSVPLPWPDIVTSPTFKDDLGPHVDALPRYLREG